MSSGWRHSVRLSQAPPKNAMVSVQTSARRLFALALAPATPREQVKPRPSQTNSCDRSHIGMAKPWAMKP